MSRDLDGTNDEISLGTAALFPRASAWSVLIFFFIRNTATDDRCLISKWGSSPQARFFLLRTDLQTAPSNLEVYFDNSLRISGGDNVALDTWYCACVTCSGSGVSNDITLFLVDMSGTFLDDGLLGSHRIASNTTADIKLGETDSGGDDMDGLLGYFIYVRRQIFRREVLAYVRDPMANGVAWRAQSGLEFFHPLWGIHSPEIDFSGNGIAGVLTGTTRGNNPPVPPYPKLWTPGPLVEAAAIADDMSWYPPYLQGVHRQIVARPY